MRLLLSILLLLFYPVGAFSQEKADAPFYTTIKKIMEPLEYSGVPVMLKPQVSLGIDFGNHTWTLHNIHEYNAQGGIILVDNRYGLCAELATFLFEKIRPLMGPRYDIKFAMVYESGFFSTGQSNHIVLLLADKSNGSVYLIDPSFHVYARVKDLADYHVLNVQNSLSFIEDKSHDVTFASDEAIPLYIKNDYLLSFSVTSVDGKFDKDNFTFAISAVRRNKFAGRDIVLVGRHNKEFQDFEDKHLLHELLTQEEINALYDKLKFWIQRTGL